MTAFTQKSFTVKTGQRRDCGAANHWPRKIRMQISEMPGNIENWVRPKEIYECTFCGACCTVDGKSVGEDK